MKRKQVKKIMWRVPYYTNIYIPELDVFLEKRKLYDENGKYIKDVVVELQETKSKWYFDRGELKEE